MIEQTLLEWLQRTLMEEWRQVAVYERHVKDAQESLRLARARIEKFNQWIAELKSMEDAQND